MEIGYLNTSNTGLRRSLLVSLRRPSASSRRAASASCAALALDERSSLAIRLEADSKPAWASVARRMNLPDLPGAAALDTLWAGPRLAEVATTPLGEGWLAATVTDHPEGAPTPPLPSDVDRRAEVGEQGAKIESLGLEAAHLEPKIAPRPLES